MYEVLARATSERGEVVLRGDGAILELRVNGVFVMDTAEVSSEIELAKVALRQTDRPRRVLVGGLGLGFTAHEVLADPRVQQVQVVEIEEALIGWFRDGTVPHGPSYLADGRLIVVNADVIEALRETPPQSLDLILLDVDNGPGNLVYEHNSAVYTESALSAAHDVLAPGGALVIWSAAPAPALAETMSTVFGNCREISHPVVLNNREEQYLLYLSVS